MVSDNNISFAKLPDLTSVCIAEMTTIIQDLEIAFHRKLGNFIYSDSKSTLEFVNNLEFFHLLNQKEQ